MSDKFFIGQNVYYLFKDTGAFPKYEVKGTQIIGVKEEVELGKVYNDRTVEIRYKLLSLADRWILGDTIYNEYKIAKSVCDSLNAVDKAHRTAQSTINIKHG